MSSNNVPPVPAGTVVAVDTFVVVVTLVADATGFRWMDDTAGASEVVVVVVVVVLNTGVDDDSKSNDSFNGSNFGGGAERSDGTEGGEVVVVDSLVFLRDLYMLLNFNNPITARKRK